MYTYTHTRTHIKGIRFYAIDGNSPTANPSQYRYESEQCFWFWAYFLYFHSKVIENNTVNCGAQLGDMGKGSQEETRDFPLPTFSTMSYDLEKNNSWVRNLLHIKNKSGADKKGISPSWGRVSLGNHFLRQRRFNNMEDLLFTMIRHSTWPINWKDWRNEELHSMTQNTKKSTLKYMNIWQKPPWYCKVISLQLK